MEKKELTKKESNSMFVKVLFSVIAFGIIFGLALYFRN